VKKEREIPGGLLDAHFGVGCKSVEFPFFEGSSIGSGERSTVLTPMQAHSDDLYNGAREGYVGKRNKKIVL
jgi:hypothetical protein